jgi:hypothetical protein
MKKLWKFPDIGGIGHHRIGHHRIGHHRIAHPLSGGELRFICCWEYANIAVLALVI